MIVRMDNDTEILKTRPEKKFDPLQVGKIIRDMVYENLEGKIYDHIYAPDWTKLLTRKIHDMMKGMALERYKFAVHVIIGEVRGQGLKIISECILDEETDGKASALFTGETLYCIAAVYAVYCYRYE